MIGRITNQSLNATAQRNLQANMARMAQLQDQATSQKKIHKPSDDPTATGDSLRIRDEIRATDQYGRNIGNGLGWAATIDTVLTSSTAILNRVRDLTVQGANDGAMSPAAKEAIATEIDGLKNDLLTKANTKFLGRNIFAGNSNAGKAFGAGPGYTWTGAAGSTVERRVGPDTTIRVDADGERVFGEGNASVFALLDNIVNDLRGGINVNPLLNGIDDRLKALVSEHAQLGSRHARLERADELNVDAGMNLEARRSDVEDIDMAKTILDLSLHEVNYQAALAVTAKVLPPTLMDYLR